MFISYFFYSILKFHQISERHTLWPIQKWSIRKLPKDRTSIRAHNSIQGKNRICSRTKLYPLQSIQDVYQAFTQTMEPSNGDMEERQSPNKGISTTKEKRSKHVTNFQTISWLNVEGKIFFAVLERRMPTFLTANQYIDTSVQNGGVPGFSGCLEHTSAINQIISEAKVNNKDLTVICLDLANAYGSIPHKMIDEALKH